MNLSTQSVLNYGIQPTLKVLNKGFSDYIVPAQLDLAGFHRMLRVDGINIDSSLIIFREDNPIGVALTAQRGWNTRLAGMAIVPEARGQGVGQWTMKQLLDKVRSQGIRRMELEVICGNDPAIQLYQKIGFQVIRKLLSLKAENPPGSPALLKQEDIREVARRVAIDGLPDLPWQISSENLSHTGPPNQGVHLDSAWVVISSPRETRVHLQSLLVAMPFRRQGRAKNLLKGLFSKYPNKTWYVPALLPEEIVPVFESVGFQTQTLSQFQMAMDLD